MTLIIKARLIGYFGKGSRSCRQFAANEIQSQLADIVPDCAVVMSSENAGEMNGVDTYGLGDGGNGERVGKMRVD